MSWFSEGIKFQCQGSGKCCVSRGEYGYVYLTLEDRKRLAKHLNLSPQGFFKKYCTKTDEVPHLIQSGPECLFLKDDKCSVYEARPTQCRTWPFWPDTLKSQKSWSAEITAYCPGAGKDKWWSIEEITEQLNSQEKAEQELFGS